jgi:uncharacterized protein YkwD
VLHYYEEPSAPAAPRGASAGSAAPAAGNQSLVDQTLALINGDRAGSGLAPVRLDATLSRAAAKHAGQNAAQDRLFHDGLVDVVNAEGVSWRSLGEILGMWQPTPDIGGINNFWMHSPDHRAIILGSFTTVGIGWSVTPSGHWFVSAIFIS